MKYCSHCGTATKQVTTFCSNCGAPLTEPQGPLCPACHTVNPPGAVVCTGCAAPLPGAESSKPRSLLPIKGLTRPVKPLPPADPRPAAAKPAERAAAHPAAAEPRVEPPPSTPVEDDVELFPMDADLPAQSAAPESAAPESAPSEAEEKGPALPTWLIRLRKNLGASAPAETSPYGTIQPKPAQAQQTAPAPSPIPRWFEGIRPPEVYRRPDAVLKPESNAPSAPAGPHDSRDKVQAPERLPVVNEESHPPEHGPDADSRANIRLAIARLAGNAAEQTTSLRPSSQDLNGAPEWRARARRGDRPGTGSQDSVRGPTPQNAAEGEKPADPETSGGSETHGAEPEPEPGEIPEWLKSLLEKDDLRTVRPLDEFEGPVAPPATDAPPQTAGAEPEGPAAETPQPEADFGTVPGWQLPSWLLDESIPAETGLFPDTPQEPRAEELRLDQTPAAPPALEVAAEDRAVEEPPESATRSYAEALPETSAPPVSIGADAALPEPTPAAPEPGELPDWIRSPGTPVAVDEGAHAAPGVLEPLQSEAGPLPEAAEKGEGTAVPTSTGELPDWLGSPDLEQAEVEVPDLSLGEEGPVAGEETPETGEIPAWVEALRPAELLRVSLPVPQPEEDSPTVGALAGLRGVLPVAEAIAGPHAAPASAAAPVEGGGLMEGVVATPPELAQGLRPERSRRYTVPGLVIGAINVLVLVAMILPFFLPPEIAGLGLTLKGGPTVELFETARAIQPESTVLLAFDYDAGQSGELDPAARVLLRDWMYRRVRVLAVSTTAAGAALAQELFEEARRDQPDLKYGTDFVNLGFLPGNEAGLRTLADAGFAAIPSDFSGAALKSLPATASLRALSDLALIVEIAGSREALRGWIEQVVARPAVPAGGPALRVAAAVSAALEPEVRTYRSAGQVVAYMRGLVGAAEFEILANKPGRAAAALDAQTLASLALALVLIIGNLVYWAGRGFRLRRTRR